MTLLASILSRRTILAPAWIEHDLPTVWLEAVDYSNRPGEVKPRLFIKNRQVSTREWAKAAIEAGACFFAIFSQDATKPGWSGGYNGWPDKEHEPIKYAEGQLKHLSETRGSLSETGYDLSSVRCLFDIESLHSQYVPLGVLIALQLGFTIGGSHWAANFGTGPLSYGWLNTPCPDGLTAGIITYDGPGTGDRQASEIADEIAAVKSQRGRYVVWYRTNSEWARKMLPTWRRDPACKGVVGWNPKGRVE